MRLNPESNTTGFLLLPELVLLVLLLAGSAS